MARAALHKCNTAGCSVLTRERHCERHSKEKRTPRENRPSAAARGYDYRWQKYSKRFLAANPLCVECEKQGRAEAASCVDHIVPHRGDETLFWSEENHQGLCDRCHGRKTRRGE